MWDCQTCGRKHRKEEALARCKARALRKKDREKKQRIDMARRLANRRRESEEDYVRRRFCRDQTRLDWVAAELNREYPPRDDKKKWTWFEVLEVHINHLNWPI